MNDPIIRVSTKDPRDGHKDVTAADLVLAIDSMDKDLRALARRWQSVSPDELGDEYEACVQQGRAECARELLRLLDGEEQAP